MVEFLLFCILLVMLARWEDEETKAQEAEQAKEIDWSIPVE